MYVEELGALINYLAALVKQKSGKSLIEPGGRRAVEAGRLMFKSEIGGNQ